MVGRKTHTKKKHQKRNHCSTAATYGAPHQRMVSTHDEIGAATATGTPNNHPPTTHLHLHPHPHPSLYPRDNSISSAILVPHACPLSSAEPTFCSMPPSHPFPFATRTIVTVKTCSGRYRVLILNHSFSLRTMMSYARHAETPATSSAATDVPGRSILNAWI